MTHDALQNHLLSLGQVVRDGLAAEFGDFIPSHRIIAHLKYGESLTDAELESLNRESRIVDREVVEHNLAMLAKWQKVFSATASDEGSDSALQVRNSNAMPAVASTNTEDLEQRFIVAWRDLIQIKRVGGTLASHLRVAIAWIARCVAFDEQQSREILQAMDDSIGLGNRSMAFRSSGENALPLTWSCDQEVALALWSDSASLRLAYGSDAGGKQLAIIELRTDRDDRDVTIAFTHRFNGRVTDRFVIRANGPPVVLLLNSGEHEYIVDVTTAGGKTMQHSIRKTV